MTPIYILKMLDELTTDQMRDRYCKIKGKERAQLEQEIYELKNPPKTEKTND